MKNKTIPDTRLLAEWVTEARRRTMDLVADLSDEQLMGPRLATVNPLLWEIGHVAWFQEKWVLRHASGEGSSRRDADALYDSIAIPHDTRWDLPLPSRKETLGYMQQVRDRVLEKLDRPEPGDAALYFTLYTLFHEDMHDEAFTCTRQILSYPAPRFSDALQAMPPAGATPGHSPSGPADAEIPGGLFMLGSPRSEPFVFDNEKWAHPIEIRPFAIARTAVTQGEFAAFVEAGGYGRREWWGEQGWLWRTAAGAEHPLYWLRDDGSGWLRRDFEQWVRLEPERPVININWFEAQAYCRWAGRRLPTEVEWEAAAAGEPDSLGRLSLRKRRFPWGDELPAPEPCSLDWRAPRRLDVNACPANDSAFGCRQMIGNVWEWTGTTFGPYPGFEADAYREYSEPWFETRKVLRGGCWATRSRLIRAAYRNFYTPDRRDVWAGFRTCRRSE